MCPVSNNKIKWPIGDKMVETAARFEEILSISSTLGAVDGCHIEISAPKEQQADYLNSKMNRSMNLMAICDSSLKYIFVNAGFPGSAHDQRVLLSFFSSHSHS
jgi:hypothetical protein